MHDALQRLAHGSVNLQCFRGSQGFVITAHDASSTDQNNYYN
jgi:hypothetical protein